jgi:hypothetical protein
VHARIRASRGVDRQAALRKLFQNIRQRALDRGLAGLRLPSAKIRAVVSDGEFYISHGIENQWNHRCTQMNTDKKKAISRKETMGRKWIASRPASKSVYGVGYLALGISFFVLTLIFSFFYRCSSVCIRGSIHTPERA